MAICCNLFSIILVHVQLVACSVQKTLNIDISSYPVEVDDTSHSNVFNLLNIDLAISFQLLISRSGFKSFLIRAENHDFFHYLVDI